MLTQKALLGDMFTSPRLASVNKKNHCMALELKRVLALLYGTELNKYIHTSFVVLVCVTPYNTYIVYIVLVCILVLVCVAPYNTNIYMYVCMRNGRSRLT